MVPWQGSGLLSRRRVPPVRALWNCGLLWRQKASRDRRQRMIQIGSCPACSPTFAPLEALYKISLEVVPCRLPDETNGTPGKGNVVTRFDAIQIFKEEAATGESCLKPILGF